MQQEKTVFIHSKTLSSSTPAWKERNQVRKQASEQEWTKRLQHIKSCTESPGQQGSFQMASTADKPSWQNTAFNFLLQMHTESLRHW